MQLAIAARRVNNRLSKISVDKRCFCSATPLGFVVVFVKLCRCLLCKLGNSDSGKVQCNNSSIAQCAVYTLSSYVRCERSANNLN